LAAEQGIVAAQNNLALVYYNGEGVVQDNVAAHMWANIAAANGSLQGAGIRDIIAQTLSLAEFVAAQTMARKCIASNYANCGY
jgi:TPR repeat protein